MSRRWLEDIADVIERTTAAEPTHEKLVRWGWVWPSGDPIPWQRWATGNSWFKQRDRNRWESRGEL